MRTQEYKNINESGATIDMWNKIAIVISVCIIQASFYLYISDTSIMHLSCYDYAMQYIARYPKTSVDLDRQLQKKGYSSQERSMVIEQLTNIGLLDDMHYAEQYLLSEVVRKGKPLFVVQQKLYQKGVDRACVQDLCITMEEDLRAGQSDKLHVLWEQYIARIDSITPTHTQSFVQKMQTRGYNWQLVQSIITSES